VVVYESDQPGRSVVAALDPVEALSLSGNEALGEVAIEVKRRLQAALEQVAAA